VLPDEFRHVLGSFASGVTVVTTCDRDAQPAGLTVSAFASVSLDPPLVLVCVGRGAQSYPSLAAAGRFAVNVLADGQEAISRRFATASPGRAAEKFEGIGWKMGALGCPLIDDALAHLECSTTQTVEGGDHTIFLGRVEAGSCRDEGGGAPLLYYRGRYSRLERPRP
jgi:flavin reductase (DIM6/NTAB) family NADH-FMN oxidoreductase RutF